MVLKHLLLHELFSRPTLWQDLHVLLDEMDLHRGTRVV
jgi:hypothetical protein